MSQCILERIDGTDRANGSNSCKKGAKTLFSNMRWKIGDKDVGGLMCPIRQERKEKDVMLDHSPRDHHDLYYHSGRRMLA